MLLTSLILKNSVLTLVEATWRTTQNIAALDSSVNDRTAMSQLNYHPVATPNLILQSNLFCGRKSVHVKTVKSLARPSWQESSYWSITQHKAPSPRAFAFETSKPNNETLQAKFVRQTLSCWTLLLIVSAVMLKLTRASRDIKGIQIAPLGIAAG